eukprot:IDg7556t1
MLRCAVSKGPSNTTVSVPLPGPDLGTVATSPCALTKETLLPLL